MTGIEGDDMSVIEGIAGMARDWYVLSDDDAEDDCFAFTPSAETTDETETSIAADIVFRTTLHIAKCILHIFQTLLELCYCFFQTCFFFFKFRFRVIGL